MKGNFLSFSSVQFSRSVMPDSLRPHGSQHARPPCPSNSQSSLKLMCIELVMSPSRFGDDLSHGPWASLEGARAGTGCEGAGQPCTHLASCPGATLAFWASVFFSEKILLTSSALLCLVWTRTQSRHISSFLCWDDWQAGKRGSHLLFRHQVVSSSSVTPWIPTGSSGHGISQARKLEWISISCSRGSSWPRYRTHLSCIAGGLFATEPLGNQGGPASQVAQWQRIYLPMEETQETWVQSLGREDPLEEETATHSSILAWRIPWTKEPGGLQSMGSQESDAT